MEQTLEQTLVLAVEQKADPLQPFHPQPASGSAPFTVCLRRSRPPSPLRPRAAHGDYRCRPQAVERQYVDGNGGNISVRLGDSYLLCTPTMMSKRDMEPADICLSDLDGNILAGDRMRTSELLLHLEIYRSNPRARAVVHCHPPHATAFAMTGTTPPSG